MKNIFRIFTAVVAISMVLLMVISYNNSKYDGKELPLEIQTKLKQKEYHIQKLIVQKYNKNINIPIIISDKIKDNLFGLAVYDQNSIKIILNKNRFQESSDYMIDYVLPHEYAHALMFVFRDFTKENGGHTLKWQKICLDLEGKKCDRFVKHDDIVLGKLEFLY
ncbi:MAG: SprT-like domain-containing protein [Campylobacterales bacterium]|nr:SprT-like domain-containing protein [Campylobacterales bacterium]